MHFLAYIHVVTVSAFRDSRSRMETTESMVLGQSVKAGDEAFKPLAQLRQKHSGYSSSYVIGGSDSMGSSADFEHIQTTRISRIMVHPKIKALLDQNHSVMIIQVGACDGDFRSSNDQVQDTFGRSNVRAELIEPNPAVFKTLETNLKNRYGTGSKIHASNVAMCKMSGNVSFFVVRPEFAKDYPNAPHWAKFQLSSMNKQQVLEHSKLLGLSEGAFAKYVEEINVPCRSAKDFFHDIDVQPRDVNVLVVDAEGFDDEVVKSFLEVDKCRPSVISFENKHLSASARSDLDSLLASKKYVTEQSGGDTVCTLTH